MSASNTFKLPEGFLSGPAPELTRTDVDWVKGGLPEYQRHWAVVLDGVLTEEECDQMVAAAEAKTDSKWERAMVNIGGGRQALYEETRNCGRIIWDDSDIVAKLWTRIQDAVPDIHQLKNWPNVTGNGPSMRHETWTVTRLNERMRFLKYTGGEYFKAHQDGTYETPDRKERSYFTLHLYLNDPVGKVDQKPLKGGATTFHSYGMDRQIDVVPKAGRVLLFQHRFLLHSGEDVVSGTKLTMRTDIMFKKEDKH
ncbi:oxidoreductase domain-containing protein [Aaosphaeria arxii CBS 175.79]|uniref:Oxidoreductase domain-containing protein n=1 Tax=Aaosphaeria arxii CBS 175.79 TaxID=1450172 RepID=A0A6A5XYR3_9PLEO|nr:oxidoreductase domain-containing protein [Aaosphaeria arxii CBS 175.79]KAF2017770.1 oxidoreductase domain-containing protein [Aaosphaeria arxii CBS 175.79]